MNNPLEKYTEVSDIKVFQGHYELPTTGRLDQPTLLVLSKLIQESDFQNSDVGKEIAMEGGSPEEQKIKLAKKALKLVVKQLYENQLDNFSEFLKRCAKYKMEEKGQALIEMEYNPEFEGSDQYSQIYAQGGKVVKYERGGRQVLTTMSSPVSITKAEIMKLAAQDPYAAKKLGKSKSFRNLSPDTVLNINPDGTFSVEGGQKVGLGANESQIRLHGIGKGWNKASKGLGALRDEIAEYSSTLDDTSEDDTSDDSTTEEESVCPTHIKMRKGERMYRLSLTATEGADTASVDGYPQLEYDCKSKDLYNKETGAIITNLDQLEGGSDDEDSEDTPESFSSCADFQNYLVSKAKEDSSIVESYNGGGYDFAKDSANGMFSDGKLGRRTRKLASAVGIAVPDVCSGSGGGTGGTGGGSGGGTSESGEGSEGGVSTESIGRELGAYLSTLDPSLCEEELSVNSEVFKEIKNNIANIIKKDPRYSEKGDRDGLEIDSQAFKIASDYLVNNLCKDIKIALNSGTGPSVPIEDIEEENNPSPEAGEESELATGEIVLAGGGLLLTLIALFTILKVSKPRKLAKSIIENRKNLSVKKVKDLLKKAKDFALKKARGILKPGEEKVFAKELKDTLGQSIPLKLNPGRTPGRAPEGYRPEKFATKMADKVENVTSFSPRTATLQDNLRKLQRALGNKGLNLTDLKDEFYKAYPQYNGNFGKGNMTEKAYSAFRTFAENKLASIGITRPFHKQGGTLFSNFNTTNKKPPIYKKGGLVSENFLTDKNVILNGLMARATGDYTGFLGTDVNRKFTREDGSRGVIKDGKVYTIDNDGKKKVFDAASEEGLKIIKEDNKEDTWTPFTGERMRRDVDGYDALIEGVGLIPSPWTVGASAIAGFGRDMYDEYQKGDLEWKDGFRSLIENGVGAIPVMKVAKYAKHLNKGLKAAKEASKTADFATKSVKGVAGNAAIAGTGLGLSALVGDESEISNFVESFNKEGKNESKKSKPVKEKLYYKPKETKSFYDYGKYLTNNPKPKPKKNTGSGASEINYDYSKYLK